MATSDTEQEQLVRILVVEDDIHIGRLIGLAMPALRIPYRFTNVMSAIEALELWKKESFDLLLTDYNLPGANGLQLISELKRQGSRTPMVLLTAYGSPEIERKAYDIGVSAYLTKPFDIDDLIDTIRMLLQDEQQFA